jgi:TonB family protein
MRGRLVLAALLLSSIGLIAQTKDPSSSSSSPSSSSPSAASPPPQEKSGSTKPPAVAVTGKDVTPGRLIHKVAPKYPKAAKKAHIEGTVVLSATIFKDGTIHHLDVVSGPAELIPAAMEAVRQWRYSPPYMLKNEPVAVTTPIIVNFELH